LCKEEKIDGIFSGFTDSVLPYMQQVSVRTGLPFWGDERNIDICIDKMKFKEACEEAGVPVIPWIKVNDSNYLEKIESVQCPVVVKPVDSSGSRGVYKCFDKYQLADYCQKAFEYSQKKEILIERLMNVSNEFSAYYVMFGGG
jgi:biotin carboxylase